MLSVFLLILPIYILIAAGFASVKLKYLGAEEMRGLGRIVLRLFMPAMMFLAIASNPISETLRWDFIIGYAAASLATYAASFGVARLAGQPFGAAALEAMGSACSNSAFLGLPIATLVVGPTVALQCFALAVLVENLLVIPIAVGLCEAGQGAGRVPVARILSGVAKSPLLAAAVAGLGWAVSGLTLPGPVDQVLRMMAPVAAPVALLTIGATVAQLSLRSVGFGVLRVVPGKLILHPLAVLAAFTLIGTLPHDLMIAGVVTASVPMMTIYTLFGQRFGREGMTATAQILATAVSFFTVSLILSLLR
ncbi:AEC family transporter [Ostreiculturibacter nitratireducens]|uniref:AEC family transporter n=1 Tax=Ostreiculturibacter nitratireducens TaxID=3075226 RepID=UPI0031B5732E